MPTWGDLAAQSWALNPSPGLSLSDMVRQINRDTREKFSNADITDWINRALDDLTPVAKLEELKTSPIVDANSYALPDGLHKINGLFVNGAEYFPILQRDSTSTGYKIWNSQFSLQNGDSSGQIELYYYRKFTKLKYPTDVPEIEEEFQDLLILYAIGQLQFRESDDRPDALNKYYARKKEYEQYKNTKHVVPVSIQDVYGLC